jgi:hypothetical protein
MRSLLLIAFCAAFVLNARADDTTIWIEGESATQTNMKPHPWYAGAVNKSLLSGGDFISNFSPQEGRADYQFTAPRAGSYTFWIRANPVGQPLLDYQLNGGAWTPVDFSHATDVQNIARDGKPDLRFIGWIKVGAVDLNAGANAISFRFHSANNNHGSLDCFLFTQAPFVPNGKAKPGEKLGTDESGWFSFEPKPETFAPDALLDLRSLNEKEAGQSGFIDASSDQFKLGNGQPVRFWGVNVGFPENPTHDDLDFMAARFAKLGINLVRLGIGGLIDKNGPDITRIDPKRLDDVFYAVEALKKQGIYTHFCTYFVLDFPLKANWGIPGTDDALGRQPFGLLIFEPRMQEIYKAWVKQILTIPDPYNGSTLAQEPAVAIFEIQNEDSLFFWSFDPAKCGSGPRELLEKKFGDWLMKKYNRRPDQIPQAWPSAKLPDDFAFPYDRGPSTNTAASDMIPLFGLYAPWFMSRDGFAKQSPDVQKRLLDQIHFYADVQRDFYADMHKYLRDDLGVKSPISASNWITVPGLEFIERYTYTPAEVIDKHGYFGGKHTGPESGWSVRPGHYYEEKTAMYDPASVPFQYVRLPGHPHVQSEVAWNHPNRYIAEAAPLISAYESLQGVDGVENFAAGDGNWINNGGNNWPYMMPGEIGQSPAEALQYRRGDLKPGDTVVRDVVSVDDLLNLKGNASLAEGKSADFHAVEGASGAGATDNFDPLTFLVGRVERSFDTNAQPISTDLTKYIDRDKKIITSSTGQIIWDYGNGLLTVDSPTSQAAAGFLAKAGPIKLGDVTIESGNECGAIHVISLDGKPLATSNKILIQAFTEEKMYGFKAASGFIQDIGRPPVCVRDIDAQVTFTNGVNLKAEALDEQGYARDPLTPQVNGASATIVLPKDTLYTIVTRP